MASYVPARRAMRLDPIATLKNEWGLAILCAGLPGLFRPQELEHETVAAGFHFLRALLRPVVEALAGFDAQIAARDFVLVDIGRVGRIVQILRNIIDDAQAHVEAD